MSDTAVLELVKRELLSRAGKHLKVEGAEWRMNNPTDTHSDSMGFKFNAETGLWKDHAHNQEGNALTLARLLGLELPERTPVENSKRDYRSLEDYATRHGAPVEAFIKAGWNPKPINYSGRPALEFKTTTGLRYRFLDGEKPPFKSQKGYKRCWYGLDRAVRMATEGKLPALVITNGEPSVAVAHHFGVPAFAMTSGETNTVPPELMTELQTKWTGDLIVALDCDLAGDTGAEHYRRTLSSAGYRFRIVDLGLADKGDLADLCKLHTSEAWDALLKCADMVTKAPAAPAKPVNGLEDALRELATARQQANGGDLAKLINRVQFELDALRGIDTRSLIKPFDVVIDEYSAWLDEVAKNGGVTPGLRTGINALDEYLGGRLPFGTVTTVLASTNQGKSTLTASIASNLIMQAPGLVISTETKARRLLNRMVAYRLNVNVKQIIAHASWDAMRWRVNHVLNFFRNEHCIFLEASNPTPTQIMRVADTVIGQYDCKWVVIDSLSNVGADNARAGIFDRTEEAADVAAVLAGMNLAVLATSQVGRSMKGRSSFIPTMHDGKGSGRIEENADVLMALYNHEHYVRRGEAEPSEAFPPGTVLLKMLKNRDGELADHAINLQFRGGIGVYDLPELPQ